MTYVSKLWGEGVRVGGNQVSEFNANLVNIRWLLQMWGTGKIWLKLKSLNIKMKKIHELDETWCSTLHRDFLLINTTILCRFAWPMCFSPEQLSPRNKCWPYLSSSSNWGQASTSSVWETTPKETGHTLQWKKGIYMIRTYIWLLQLISKTCHTLVACSMLLPVACCTYWNYKMLLGSAHQLCLDSRTAGSSQKNFSKYSWPISTALLMGTGLDMSITKNKVFEHVYL